MDLSPLLTPLFSEFPVNAQQFAMRVQVLIIMGQGQIPKEESGELLDEKVHVVAMTYELCHSTRKFVRLTGE